MTTTVPIRAGVAQAVDAGSGTGSRPSSLDGKASADRFALIVRDDGQQLVWLDQPGSPNTRPIPL
jgi:hypothetical protein